jgi:hypothetical protein
MKQYLCALTLGALLAKGCGGLDAQRQASDLLILYTNAQYRFTFRLPASWRGYSVLTQGWEGVAYLPAKDRAVAVEHGPVLVLRHPQWKADKPYQDIPVLVLTRSQWQRECEGKFGIGAGGFDEEIGHNSEYVFAVSSRFNAADEVGGWKEASEAVERNRASNGPPLVRR